MIAEQLKVEIEGYAERLRSSSRLLCKARNGELAPRVVQTFLWNIRYVLGETPRNLELAQRVAVARGQAELSAFYGEKIGEESGHDRWAEHDLLSLNPELDLASALAPLDPLAELMTFLRATIRREPSEFLVYMLFVEYLTVLLGPEWLAALEARCGIPSSSMTSIGRHVELDKHHVEDDLATIRALLPADADPGALISTLRRFMSYWERFYDQLAELPN
ncbi:MAG TPA: hypothetical protein VI072_19515 [Polyangiaceae bacterium]